MKWMLFLRRGFPGIVLVLSVAYVAAGCADAGPQRTQGGVCEPGPDGVVDCSDPACLFDPACSRHVTEVCDNGVDDTGNGKVDR